MLKFMGVIGSIMTVVGISSGILNRSMLAIAAIGLALMSISVTFLPKNDNFKEKKYLTKLKIHDIIFL